MRLITAILVGRLIAYLTKLFKIGGGSAAPGLYALKIDPKLINKLIKKISSVNIAITGTNGKTTTARLLAHFAKANNYKVIHNRTGSNLERGIASTLISNFSLKHLFVDPKKVIGIWELDEAAFNKVALKLNPEVIIFLNLFRDQLDRYGEVDTVMKQWCQTLKTIGGKDTTNTKYYKLNDLLDDKPLTVVFANGDDANTVKLKGCFEGDVDLFGLEGFKIKGETSTNKKSKLDLLATDIEKQGLTGTSFKFKAYEEEINVQLPIPGIYNVYNFIAAYAAGTCFQFDLKKTIKSLENFSPAFGRVEKLPFGYIFLIKNPIGATQVFETIAPNIKNNDRLLLALNDNLADGTDVSWIWDGEFEKLKVQSARLKIICSGTRAYDLALRLKYAGIDPRQITIEPDLEKALKEARQGLEGRLFVLPTYTVMLELQSILTKAGIKKHYWKEE